MQESFVRVLRNLDRFDTRYRFSTWLFTIARNAALNALARERGRPASAEELARETGTDARPEEALEDYTIYNARVGIGGVDGRWRALLWARNLTDESWTWSQGGELFRRYSPGRSLSLGLSFNL